MEFHRDTSADLYVIRGYGPEGIRIGQRVIARSCIVTPERIVEAWPVTEPAQLVAGDLDELFALAPEIVILGTGSTLDFPPPAIGAALAARGIGLEVMDTAAACRTYNVLVHEGRGVAAALILD